MIHLVRIDPVRNMARFYRLSVEPDLFGEVALSTEWGRIGHSGTCRNTLYPSLEAAVLALDAKARAKERRGYRRPA